ncbi:hypothetical protein ACFX15_000887 [Malus domestica]
MTKKFTRFEPQFAMELDLDSFLNSHVSLSDEDYDDDHHFSSVPHRTIDEILNDTDSSASSSPPSPWFLGGMRTNAKPGAALAAAAAASRLMPTPQSTAIKSRRSAGSGVIQKVLESSELDDNSVMSFNSNGDTNAIGSEVIRTNSNELQVDFGGELLRNGGVLKSENELEQASQVDEASAGNAVEEEKNVSSSYENLTSLDANDVKDTEFNDNSPCSKESDTKDNEGCGDGKDDGGGGKESKDNNGNIGNGSDIDDDEELGSSITQLVEERIGELESRWISKKAEKKLRKPLEIAEELEKKQASTALHWEEGAAAQPMRLEGVHRGSTTLGYFNVDANNPITRTLSSPALRRDHGSPQVLRFTVITLE